MTWPTVTEQPLRLEPTSRDPFLDGLTGVIPSTSPRRPAAAGAGQRFSSGATALKPPSPGARD
jgi:hypothetical protein